MSMHSGSAPQWQELEKLLAGTSPVPRSASAPLAAGQVTPPPLRFNNVEPGAALSTPAPHLLDEPDRTCILLVDDAVENVEILRETLRSLGHEILVAAGGREALAIARQSKPTLILLDVVMPEMDGLEVCRVLKADPQMSNIPVIFCSALDDTEAKLEGFGVGAVDFITKPYEPGEVVARVSTQLKLRGLQRGLEQRNADLERELTLAQELRREALRGMQEAMIGTSEAAIKLRTAIENEARASSALLLLAAPGCGEEAVARAIHDASNRSKRPFVAIECAQMSFTDLDGAIESCVPFSEDSRSKLHLARGGTLFLSGVNHLPASLQLALRELLVRQEARVSGASSTSGSLEAGLDIRIIASAPSRLTEGSFPSDYDALLAEWLSRHVLRLPTLADRRDDIPALVDLFVARHAHRMGRVLEAPTEVTLSRLAAYAWPGNLRELEDVVRRSIIASRGPRIEVAQALLGEGIPFGSYRLLRKLGSGGMGEVWEARHDLLARPAAIKLIRPEHVAKMKYEALRRRFEREARATANLGCQHTVTLYDFGVSENGAFYYVMELLHGMDLEHAIEKFGPMPAGRAVHLLMQACRSLAEAHSAGLVHRDIKPANLFICKLGLEVDQLKVLDFGMVSGAKGSDETRISMVDEIYGTPECISPEAAAGVPELDGRADVYGLGCVAYWLLTGKVVFEATSAMGMLIRHLRDQPEPPSKRGAGAMPGGLEELLMLCLEKDRDRRPSALELLDGLAGTGLAASWTDQEARGWWMSELPELMER